MAEKKEKMLLPMNLQFFAEGGEGTGAQTTAQEPTAQQTPATEPKQEPLTTEAIEKIIQSRVDKSNAELGKKIAALQKENESLKKEKMTAEELKKFEDEEREKMLQEKERDIKQRENRWFAMNAIKEIGLDDGSKLSLDLVDFVMDDTEEKITAKVKAFNELVQNFVSAKVDAKFKAIGRTPNGATQSSEQKETSIAEQLGKRKAEQSKKSNDVLELYLKGGSR